MINICNNLSTLDALLIFQKFHILFDRSQMLYGTNPCHRDHWNSDFLTGRPHWKPIDIYIWKCSKNFIFWHDETWNFVIILTIRNCLSYALEFLMPSHFEESAIILLVFSQSTNDMWVLFHSNRSKRLSSTNNGPIKYKLWFY